MTELRFIEGLTGKDVTIDLGTNISAYDTAILSLVSFDYGTVYKNDISLTIASAANGLLTWNVDTAADLIPAVPTGKRELTIKGQVTLTAAGLKELFREFDIVIEKNIGST